MNDPSTFFNRLFKALEVGQRTTGERPRRRTSNDMLKKADTALLARLSQAFSAPPIEDREAAAGWFASNCRPEDVMGWLLADMAPFAVMLKDIYSWLADGKATVGGNIEEVGLDFSRMSEWIDFPLESFPMTYVERWQNSGILVGEFDRTARGRVRVDTPNHWRDNALALPSLINSCVLEPRVFDDLAGWQQRIIAARLATIIGALSEHWTEVRVPPDMAQNWQLSEYRRPLVLAKADWEEVLHGARQPGSDGGVVTHDAARRLSDLRRNLRDELRLIDASRIYALADHVATLGLDADTSAPVTAGIGPESESDDVYAFLSAYNLCCPAVKDKDRICAEVVDQVLMPFWRHRWRLLEVWAILWMMNALPGRYRPEPILAPRGDKDHAFLWRLAGGDAVQPVAESRLPSHTLSIWFQLKTPLSAADAAVFRQGHIEPDIRLRREKDGVEEDLAILELKDRHLAAGSEEKRVARMYATTRAAVVCLANHSSFRPRALHGQVYRESVGRSAVYICDDFQPSATPILVEVAIRDTVVPKVDLLLDASGSMDVERGISVVDLLVEAGVEFGQRLYWSSGVYEAGNEAEWRSCSGGSTDLRRSLQEGASRLSGRRAIIVTDRDGSEQFSCLIAGGEVDAQQYISVDVTRAVDVARIKDWVVSID